MRRARFRRPWSAVLGLVLVLAGPTSGLAHALAHHEQGQHSDHHLTSLVSHDGQPEVSAPDHSRDDHQHPRLDQGSRKPAFELDFGPAAALSGAGLIPVAAAPVLAIAADSFRPPAPPGGAATRVRAPPHC